MNSAFRENNSVGEVWAIAVSDPEGGKKASGTLTFSGTVTAAGTVYVYIVLAKTLRLALENFDQKEKYVSKLNKYLIKELQTIPDVIINTGGKVSSHIVNFSCIGYKPEVILHALEEKDILISTRSACSSKTSDVSRVMQQLHLPDEVAKSALRVSISDLTKEEEIDKFIYCLKEVLDSIKKQR